ncbi:MAG: tetratricopeptide repeat-containing protein [Neorhizobium sp.]|nr:tetratricopeptide repeat-containing protein [Neorhizobium sp.]
MDISTPLDQQFSVTGKARIVGELFGGLDIAPTWSTLYTRVTTDPNDAAAFYDLSLILETLGNKPASVETLKAALGVSRQYRIKNGNGEGARVLVFVTTGDFMANTPVEFLLEASNTVIHLYFVDGETTKLDDVPEHDVAFLAIGHSKANFAVLDRMDQLLKTWPRPVVNSVPGAIKALSRDGVAGKFENEPSILAPKTVNVVRQQVIELARGDADVASLLEGSTFPIIVRPTDTHAGEDMAKIADAAQLLAYMDKTEGERFFLCPFIDYSDADGKFRKQRIAFIDGRAYVSHFAVSEHWMVHYLSAGMLEYAERRDEEARWMATFDEDFALRYAVAFAALQREMQLDYFAIDCAELPDGRLLLFEADNAMIVHSMDPEAVFPYKKAPMARLFSAFETMLEDRAQKVGATPAGA